MLLWEKITGVHVIMMLKIGSQYDATPCVVLRHLCVDACRNIT